MMSTEKSKWPIAIIILLLLFIVITGWSIYRASSGVSSVTDPQYYSHGLKYNRTSVETTAALTMGWKVTPFLSNSAIELTLTNKEGSSISGCTGTVTFLLDPNSYSNVVTLALEDLGQGVYRAPLPASIKPNTNAAITLSKGQATIRRNLLINI